MDWSEGTYSATTSHGKRDVYGFVNGTFGIDERANNRWPCRKKAWAIIHLPTGFAAAFVEGGRRVAQRVADDLTGCADWDFSDPDKARSRGMAANNALRKHKHALLRPNEIGPPKPARGMEARKGGNAAGGAVHDSPVPTERAP